MADMGKLPAGTGWLWIRQGFALFRKQPGGLISLAMLYTLLNLLVSVVDVLGQMVLIVLIPTFSVAFMQACLHIEQGKRVLPSLLLAGFRKPAFPRLLTVGFLYMAAAMLAMGLAWLVDDGTLFKVLSNKIDPSSAEARDANLGTAFLLIMAVGLPAAMAFCFSAPLIYFQNMSVPKALFYSFFAVWRALKTFIVFGISQFGLVLLLTQITAMLFGASPKLLVYVMNMALLLFSVLIHCSFYASYRQIFGSPALGQDKPQEQSDRPPEP